MRRRPSCPIFLFTLAVLALGTRPIWAQGQASQDGKTDKAVQPSAPPSKEQSNPAKTDALRQLEDELFRPFKTAPPKGLLNPGPELPKPAPPAQNKRVKELEQRKDWVFMKPEDLMAVPTVEDLLNLPPVDKDGRPKEKLSPVAGYLERLYHPEDQDRTKERYQNPFDKRKNSSAFGDTSEQDENELPNAVRESQRNLKKRLSESEQSFGPGSAPGSHNFFSDIFGLDVKAKELPSPMEIEAQKQRMEQLRALYGFQVAPPAVGEPCNPLSGLVQFAPQTTKAPITGVGLPSTSGNSQNLTVGVIGLPPLPDPNALPGVARLQVPQLGVDPSLPKSPQPKLAPPTPNFNAPRRQF